MRKMLWICCVLVSLLVATATAHAGPAVEPIAPEELRAKALAAAAADAAAQGWKTKLSLGATTSFSQSASMVGSPDGVSVQLGGLVDGQAEYIAGQHTWSNTLKAAYATSKTPALDQFVKAQDTLELATTYTYRLAAVSWIGPYARARFATQMAPGYLVKPGAYDVLYQQTDGSTLPVAHYGAQAFTKVTGAFDPMLFGEAVGLFANPTESEAVTVKLKLGVGTQQLVANWGYALADDAATPEIEMKKMRSAVQVGGEAEALAMGQLSTDLKWKAKAAFFMPFYTNIDATPSGIDALNSDFSAGVSYRLAKWLSLDYVFVAKHVPLITDKWQIQNGAVLTAGFIL